MALDSNRLVNTRKCSDGVRAACPACRELDGDKKGNHLFIRHDGRFGCASHKGDHSHRKRIHELVGLRDSEQFSLKYRRRPIGSSPKVAPSNFKKETLVAAVDGNLDAILNDNRTDDWRADLWDSSPIRLDGSPADDWALMLGSLFEKDAIVFIGTIFDSGPKRGAGHFQKVENWLLHSTQPGPRIAPSTFLPESIHRSKECVEEQRFLVIESDNLIGHEPSTEAERESNKSESYALFRWFVRSLGMRLAAVVDTGNKSLHGWFRMPKRPEMMEELRTIALELRIDRALFHQPNAPLRLPGAKHEKTGHKAQLLYLDNTI